RIGQSIGSIAAGHVRQRLGGLAGRAGVVVGAGEAAGDAAERLAKLGARLSVVSRSKTSAARLAQTLDAPAYALPDLAAVLDKSEFAVVAVSGGVVVRPRHLGERAGSLGTDEVTRALSGLDVPELARARIEALGMRIANKLLHGPTTALREADDTTRAAIMRMFGFD